MDRIEQLIRSVNPVPDREKNAPLNARAKLEYIMRESKQSKDQKAPPPAVGSQSPTSGRKVGWVPKAIGVGAAVALMGGAVFVANQFPQTQPPPAADPSVTGEESMSPDPMTDPAPEEPTPEEPTPSSSEQPQQTAEPDAAADWETYTTPSGVMAFELPPGWTVEPADFYNAEEVLAVQNASGELMATLANGMLPTGQACGPEQWPYTVLDSAPVDLPSVNQSPRAIDPVFSYRVLQSEPMVASYGVTDSVGSQTGENCVLINALRSSGPAGIFSFANHLMVRPQSGESAVPGYRVLEFDTIEEAEAYQESQEYQQIKRMIMSLQVLQ